MVFERHYLKLFILHLIKLTSFANQKQIDYFTHGIEILSFHKEQDSLGANLLSSKMLSILVITIQIDSHVLTHINRFLFTLLLEKTILSWAPLNQKVRVDFCWI
jgi:hypothetical protein